MTEKDQPKTSKVYWVIAFALMGAVGGYVGTDLVTGGANGEPVVDLSVSQLAAIAVGAILAFSAVIVGVGAASSQLGVSMAMFEDREQWEDERALMWLSSAGCLAFGAILILLALIEPLALAVDGGLLTVIGALVAVTIFTGWRLLSEYDELWHEVNTETCVIAVYLIFLVGGLWSVCAQLGLIAPLAPLDWITLLTASSIAGAIRATQRRGMLED